MTVTLFIIMFSFGSGVCALLTEALKKAFESAQKQLSNNLLALIDAVVVGGIGTAIAYTLMGIEWSVNNIICLALMVVSIWVGSMIGYDKVKQLLEQLAGNKEENE